MNYSGITDWADVSLLPTPLHEQTPPNPRGRPMLRIVLKKEEWGRNHLACIMQRRDDPRRSAARSGDFSEPGLLVHAPHRLRLWA